MKIRCHSVRRLFLIIICGFSVYVAINVLLRLYDETYKESSADRRRQIRLMERSIQSPLNQGKCIIPDLPVNDPSILAFNKEAPNIDCGDPSDDWVMCEKHICFVKPEIYKQERDVSCTFKDILRVHDKRNKIGRITSGKDTYILQESDFVKVSCAGSYGSGWSGFVYGVRSGVHSRARKRIKNLPHPAAFEILKANGEQNNNHNGGEGRHEKHPKQFNILIYGFDSLSRNALMRKLPKTYQYLVEKIKARVLNGYNIVGDGTAQALIPLLTGYTELELPETRWRFDDSLHVDEVYPLIWKDFEKQGYITSFNEDLPDVGTFTYRLKGFKRQPVHHYLRTFYVENSLSRKNKPHCIDHQPDHITMMNYTSNIMRTYPGVPYFIFSFHGGLSHDDINLVGVADDDIVNWLRDLHESSLLRNTILIFMSDHGNRFAEVRKTLQGKLEERLPFFSFAFPESFQKAFPVEYSNFLSNLDRLTTPFDVHATLKHILEMQRKLLKINTDSSHGSVADGEELKHTIIEEYTVEAGGYDDVNYANYQYTEMPRMTKVKVEMSALARNRALSLFRPISTERSCAEAYIEMHWCACLNWQPINLTNSEYQASSNGIILRAATTIIDTINNATRDFREYCKVLKLGQINWAMRLSVHNDLLNYKKSIDKDGFVAEISDESDENDESDDTAASDRPSMTVYQLQISLTPGNGLYEASVSHDLNTNSLETKLSQVSRINRYGDQARCIYDRNPELRKYCYC